MLGAWRLMGNRKFWRFAFNACDLLHRVGAWREMHSAEDMRRMQMKLKKNFEPAVNRQPASRGEGS